jgi:hypothetical protein
MGVRVYETEGFPEEALPLVGHDSSAGFFQHPRWMNAICKAYPRFRPICLVAEEDGVVVGVTSVVEIERFGLREVVSMPFGTHGGPVLSPEATPQAVKELNRCFVRRLRGPRTFRYEMTLLDPSQILKDDMQGRLGGDLIPGTSMILDLSPGAEELWNRYDQRLRRSVRIASRSEVVVREEKGPDGLDAFFQLYRNQAQTWELTWHHSREALGVLVNELAPDVKIWVAGLPDRDLCAQLTLYHQHREVNLWLSGALPESRPLAAFHYMLHTGVQDAARRGYRVCNFGTSMGDDGVDRFKKAFGTVGHPLLRFYHQRIWAAWIQRLRWPEKG